MTGLTTKPLRAEIAEALAKGGLGPAEVERVVRGALEEDLAYGPDVTTLATVPAGARATVTSSPGSRASWRARQSPPPCSTWSAGPRWSSSCTPPTAPPPCPAGPC